VSAGANMWRGEGMCSWEPGIEGRGWAGHLFKCDEVLDHAKPWHLSSSFFFIPSLNSLFRIQSRKQLVYMYKSHFAKVCIGDEICVKNRFDAS